MPNWVDNFISIGGKPEDVKAFVEKISASRPEQKYEQKEGETYKSTVEGEWVMSEEQEGDFSFWNLIAPPRDKWELYFSTSGWKDGERLGDTEWNWYNWNNANWGSKWDAGVEDFQDYGDDGGVSYFIKTPWDTPRPVWHALAEQHPELHIEIRYEEEQGWGGVLELSNGEVIVVDEWDIPTSHDEWVEHFDECRFCNWGEPELEFGCPAVEETKA